MNRPEQWREQCWEYVLGVLEGEERAELESRIAAGDPETLQELELALRRTAELGLLSEARQPPERVKTQLFDRLSVEPATPRPQRPEVKPFPVREAIGWAVAAGLLVFAFLANERTEDVREELDELSSRVERIEDERDALASENTLLERMQSILSSPETLGVELTSDEDPRVQAFWNERLGLFVAGADLPQPAAGNTLQLWIIPLEGEPISMGLFEPDATGRALHFASPEIPIEEAEAIAISEEPEGGSPAPSDAPLFVGPLR